MAFVALLYAPVLMSRTNGKTLGRMAVNIRVGAGVGRAARRSALAGPARGRGQVRCSSASCGAITAGIAPILDMLWPLWDEENRALHDVIVDTRVVQDCSPATSRRGAARRSARPASVQMTWSRPGADADQRDRDADEVGDEGEVVARGLREVGLLAARR